MAELSKPINLLVDIDVILDTRLAFLYYMDQDLTNRLVKNNSYHNRKKDNFERIPYDMFSALYKSRKKGILTYATLTPMCKLIRNHYGDVKLDPILTEMKEPPVIYLNTYPYNFNFEEMNNIRFMMERIVPNAAVKIVALSNAELDPAWIKDRILFMYKYDAIEWLETQTALNGLQNNPLLNVSLIAPKIATGMIRENELTDKYFKNMVFGCGTLINLIFIDAINFSTTINT